MNDSKAGRAANEIRQQLQRIRTSEWVKHQPQADGQACAAVWGSPFLRLSTNGGYLSTRALDVVATVVREQYPDRCWRYSVPLCVVTDFNDHPDTTQEEVERVLEKAALRLDEQVGE